jgi:hypothetical protein
VNENEGDTIQAYGGNKSAGLRVRKALREIEIMCVDVRNVLFDKPLQKNAASHKKQAGGAEGADPTTDGAKEDGDGAQSDDALDEDYDREIDSDIECDVEPRRPGSPARASEPGNEPVIREYQFLKTQADSVGEQRSPWPQGLQSLKPGMRVDFDGQRQVPPMQMTPPAHHVIPPPIATPQYSQSPKWPPAVPFLNRD